MRVWNEEVLTNLDGVLEAILIELRQPPPNLPLIRGRDYGLRVSHSINCATSRRIVFMKFLGESYGTFAA